VNIELDADGYRLASPHRDLEAWEVQICDAFGTRSFSTMSVFLDQLVRICPTVRNEDGERVPDELYLNAALNIVSGVRPRNEIEAALAGQMVAVHFMMMQTTEQAIGRNWPDTQTMAIAGKLARTFSMQCDSLAKLKGKTGRQRITVRSDRHYHDHKHIHAEAPGGGVKNGSQPLGTRPRADPVSHLEIKGRPALPGADAAGYAVPVSCCEGPEALPDSRRGEWFGRAKGRAQRGVQDRGLDE
jgi:hypothetical protein